MVPFLECRRQYEALRNEVDAAVAAVCRKGWFVQGDNVERFEAEWASYCGTRYCIGVGSGIDALTLALKALGIGPGDDVLTPANVVYGAIATALCGANVVLVDADEDTGLVELGALESSVTPAARVVIPVHLYGQMVDMERVRRFARAHDLRVVEDACQAHGASLRTTKAGACSDIGCFSFYPSKNLGAFGDGGAIVTDDPTLAESLRMLHNYGQQSRDRYACIGLNSRLDELQAAILRTKLPHLDRWNDLRRRIADFYHARFEPLRHVKCLEVLPEREHAYHLFVVKCERREELRSFLRDRGVGTQVHYPIPVHLQPAFAGLGLGEGNFPGAERLSGQVLSLPLFPELTSEEMEQTACAVEAFDAACSPAPQKAKLQ